MLLAGCRLLIADNQAKVYRVGVLVLICLLLCEFLQFLDRRRVCCLLGRRQLGHSSRSVAYCWKPGAMGHGRGDIHPDGRLLAVPWMFVGILSCLGKEQHRVGQQGCPSTGRLGGLAALGVGGDGRQCTRKRSPAAPGAAYVGLVNWTGPVVHCQYFCINTGNRQNGREMGDGSSAAVSAESLESLESVAGLSAALLCRRRVRVLGVGLCGMDAVVG